MLDLDRLSLIQNFVDRVGASCAMQGTIHEELKVEFGVGSGSQSDLMRRPQFDARSIAGGRYAVVSLSRSRSGGCGLRSIT